MWVFRVGEATLIGAEGDCALEKLTSFFLPLSKA